MALLTDFPVLDAWDFIVNKAKTDTDLKAFFSYTDKDGSERLRVYDEPVDNRVIKGKSFSCWFQGEAPYNPQMRKNIPLFYLDFAVQEATLRTVVRESWKLYRQVIEKLNLDSNLGGSVELHRPGNLYPVDIFKTQLWTFIFRSEYHIVPHKPTIYE